MLITFARKRAQDGMTARDVVRIAAWILAEKYSGCSADVFACSEDESSVTVDLALSPSVDSVECFEWFTKLLADRAFTLVRDAHFERALREIGGRIA
jgi:hypothetical protein